MEVSSLVSTQFQVAVERKAQEAAKEEGRQALKLIDAAAQTSQAATKVPELAQTGPVGTRLHTVA